MKRLKKIKQQIDGLLTSIEKDNKTKKIIYGFFMKDVKECSRKLIELDRQIESNSVQPAEACRKYSFFANEIIQKAEEFEKIVDRGLLKKVKNIFRMILIDGPAYKSLLFKRAYEKPQGYPGDYHMIELFYDNKPISKGIGYCGDKYILNDGYVIAVRKRKEYIKRILADLVENSTSSSINIMNLGCGPCREIRELMMSDIAKNTKLIFTLVDQDDDALSFSRNALKNLSCHAYGNIKYKFINTNILDLMNNIKYKNIIKRQDLIYSIGLADYLPDTFLGRLIKYCFGQLRPGGKLIIAHKNIGRRKDIIPDWFCDWSFFQRSKEDLADIFRTYIYNINYEIRFKEEKLKYFFFLIATKK